MADADANENSEEITAQGAIISKGTNPLECEVHIQLRFNRYGPDIIRCHLVASEADKASFENLLTVPHLLERIEGRLLTGEELIIRPPYWNITVQGWKASMHVTEIFLGAVERVPFERGTIICNVAIPHAPVVVRWGLTETSYTGTVKTKTSSKPIRWQGIIGTFTIADSYRFEWGHSGIEKGLLRIQTCEISIQKQFRESFRVDSLVSEIEKELEDPLILLSFLSRRRLSPYEYRLLFVAEDSNRQSIEATKRRSVDYGTPVPNPGFLSSQRVLSRGVFKKMLRVYKNSRYKHVLKSAIHFQLASYQYDFLEAQAVSLYSGVEALINGLSANEGGRFKSEIFAGLRQELETTIDRFFRTKKKDRGEIIDLKQQLGDLNRRHLVRRLINISKKYRVPLQELWPAGTAPEDGFRAILSRRRADLLHRGFVADRDLLSRDVIRMRAFLDLFLLRLLSFPLKKIHPLAHGAIKELVDFESIEAPR